MNKRETRKKKIEEEATNCERGGRANFNEKKKAMNGGDVHKEFH